jgi:NAD+ synthase (glutamine-hydrolysing)
VAGSLRLVVAQLNLLVGDVAGNAERVIAAAKQARDQFKAHAIVFPELTLTSYPPEDLLLRPALMLQVEESLRRIESAARGIDVILGHPLTEHGQLFNAASLLRDGRVHATYRKQLLPNYSVFDEKRYFASGHTACVVEIGGIPVGLSICEDVWQPEPVRQAVDAGARLLLILNASPYHMEKGREREALAQARAQEAGVPLVYVNLVGGQDELVFDGASFVTDAHGTVTQRCPAFEEGLYQVELEYKNKKAVPKPQSLLPNPSLEEEIYRALVLGVRDYVSKNRFPGVAIGLSGGIDSALTLCIAVDALGAERVEALMMPSRFTATMSLEDAAAQAKAMGVTYHSISIEPMFEAFMAQLKDEFQGRARDRHGWRECGKRRSSLSADVTEENIQARIRGTLLMAVSNKTGKMVLTTGNKSEMAVGYATLYGDMAGGYGAIKDVFKTMVYRLAEYRYRIQPVIPRRVFERAPSAELAPDQKDSDSLPPYDVLDPILERYVERDQSPEAIIAAGFDAATVRRVAAMVDRNEYKRRQATPGVRITRRAFGRDRRYPITSGYKEK